MPAAVSSLPFQRTMPLSVPTHRSRSPSGKQAIDFQRQADRSVIAEVLPPAEAKEPCVPRAHPNIAIRRLSQRNHGRPRQIAGGSEHLKPPPRKVKAPDPILEIRISPLNGPAHRRDIAGYGTSDEGFSNTPLQ